VPHTLTDPVLRERLSRIQKDLAEGLERLDPHRRLAGRPVSYEVIAGHTLEIVYHDVSRVDEAVLLGVERLLGERCAYSIVPQTAETITVRFVVPLRP
jgi:hypothetical protein